MTGEEPVDGLLSFEAASARVLSCLQEQLPLGMWAITRRDGEEQVFVDVRDDTFGFAPGDVASWEGSLCRRMVAGAPRLAHDTAAVEEYAATAPVQQWPVGAYVGAPIRLEDGHLYGTLCGYHSRSVAAGEVERLAPVLDLLADLLAQVLLSERLRAQAREREAELHRLATHDGLTGLATRAVFHDRLAHALELHRSDGRAITVLLMDLDDFKGVNDTHGHAVGDDLLVQVAARWAAMVSPGNTLARLGGDEFALLVEDDTPLERITAVARGVLAGQSYDVAGAPRTVGVSAGLVHLDATTPPTTAAEVLVRADTAMYAAKRSGKHHLVVHEPAVRDTAHRIPSQPAPGRPSPTRAA